MRTPLNPDRLKIPAYLRKKDLAVRAKKQLLLTALDRKKVDQPPYKKRSKPALKQDISFKKTEPKRPRFTPPPLSQNVILRAVGEVIDYFPKIQVAIIQLHKNIKKDDTLQLFSEEFLFQQIAESMQIDRKEVITAKKGAVIGLKVIYTVKPKTFVYKLGL